MSGIIGTSKSKSGVVGSSKDTAKAWVNFDGTTNTGGLCTIRDSFNVSSVSDNTAGSYNVNFETSMTNTNYVVAGLMQPTVSNAGSDSFDNFPNRSVASFRLYHYENGTMRDSNLVNCLVFGD